MKKTKVKLWASFLAEPVSIKDKDIFTYYDTFALDISTELKEEIDNWEKEYQKIYNSEYPPDSRFSSKASEQDHQFRGKELARRLQNELGDEYYVEFKP